MRATKVQSEVRRRQIAQAALELLADRGVGGLGIADIARRVGVVPSAVYRHFAGKEQVLDAVLDLIRQRLLGNVEEVRRQASSPLAQLRDLLARHARLVQRAGGVPRIIFSPDFYASQPDRKARVHAMVQDNLAEVAALVREAQQVGQADRGVDPAAAALMFLGIIQPAAFLRHLGGEFDAEAHAGRAWGLFERAIQPPSNGSAASAG